MGIFRAAALVSLVSVFSLVAVGCGNESTQTDSSGSRTPDPCASATGTDVGSVDVFGSGSAQAVRLSAARGACPNALLVGEGEDTLSLPLGQVTLEPKVRAVALPGIREQLILAKQPHPRGGFQVHLFAKQGEVLREVTVGGAPLVPFIATDADNAPTTVTCGPGQGEIELQQARATVPRGVVMAWDLFSTTFTVKGGVATLTSPEKRLLHSSPDREFRVAHKELFSYSMFGNCS